MGKLSERLERWEDMSPMEFVAVRKEVVKLEAENAVLKRKHDALVKATKPMYVVLKKLDALLTGEDDETERN